MKSVFRSTILSLAVLLTLFVATLPLFAQSVSISRKQPGNSTALLLASGDAQRGSITIENVGSVNVSVSNVSTVATTTGVVIAPSQQYQCIGIADQFYGIAASGTGDLRVTTATSTSTGAKPAPSCSVTRLNTTGITNTAAANTIPMSDGTNVVVGNVIFKLLTTAITANSTACTDAAGSFAITSNATGLNSVYRCDGSNYQLLSLYNNESVSALVGTVATTGNTDAYILAPHAGTLLDADFSGGATTLATDNTNYVTFSITNLGQSGSGTNPLLAATAANTSQTTGGSAVTADTKRALTINGTGSNLIVAKGDRLRVRVAVTGTLGATITLCVIRMTFARLS